MSSNRSSWRQLQGSSPTLLVGLFVGVFALEMLFIASYVGGISNPKPHRLPVAVVAAGSSSRTLAEQISTGSGHRVAARPYRTAQAARAAIDHDEVVGAFLPGARKDVLVVAGAPTALNEATLRSVFAPVARRSGSTLVTSVVHPLAPSDPDGLASFYLAVGWTVGGYLIGSLVGLARGSEPGPVALAARLGALGIYSVASGFLGAAILTDLLAVLPGPLLTLGAIGALTVFVTSVTTAALQRLLGEAGGTGVAIGIFVILGNPSAGGPFSRWYLSGIWRDTAGVIPTSAATEAVRRVAYFPAAGIGRQLVVMAAWGAGALVVLGCGAALAARHRTAPRPASVG